VPDDPAIDAFFPLLQRDDLVLCKDNDGNNYWPEYGITTIENWDPAQGYKCYTSQGFSINVTSLPIDPYTPGA
jgi:hypothetical protein